MFIEKMYAEWKEKVKDPKSVKNADERHKRGSLVKFIDEAGSVSALLQDNHWKHCKNFTDCKNNIAKVNKKLKEADSNRPN